MNIIATCGCVIDVTAYCYYPRGCCCGECYNDYDCEIRIDEAIIEIPCKSHGG